MHLTADLHLHSHYSRATSKDLTFEHLWKWAQLKGVNVVGTGDIAHPGWLAEMRTKLEPAEEGLFRLKDEYAAAVADDVPGVCRGTVRFLLAGEISNIYKRHDATRKVHNVVFAPSLDALSRFQSTLEKIGNIRSDGRPILGLDSRDLLEIVLENDPRGYLIPAHIWTPWFSMLGSKSGFDSVEECFGDLTPHIFALETGLSSDPPMNWRVSGLDGYTLVSNSDAHSPPKLAREATLFNTELSYDALFAALKSGDPTQFLGTLEFFPEEGKYHYDGHRKCAIAWEPPTTIAHNGLCSVCGKPVTVGTLHRIEELADRPLGYRPARSHPFESLIPLPEILSEIEGVGPTSKRVQREYFRLLEQLGSELAILRQIPLEDINAAGGPLLAEAIRRMRAGDVQSQGGYDGEFGVIRLFRDEADRLATVQGGLFRGGEISSTQRRGDAKAQGGRDDGVMGEEVPPILPTSQTSLPMKEANAPFIISASHHPTPTSVSDWLAALNDAQRTAATHSGGPLVIVAGPGTGKTRTLTVRLAWLVREQGVPPESILAITFTNKAAAEMRERLADLLGEATAATATVCTFHALGALLLREHGHAIGLAEDFVILDEDARALLAKLAWPELSAREVGETLGVISDAKNRLTDFTTEPLRTQRKEGEEENNLRESAQSAQSAFLPLYQRYESTLVESHALDFDDLIARTVDLLEKNAEILAALRTRFQWIAVDEYQDVNPAQHRLLLLLADDGQRLTAIGDPDQAIYGFRGADYRYFAAFPDDYPGATTRHLRRNYRSAQAILDAAQQVIARNRDRASLEIFSEFTEQVKLDIYRAPTDKAEAEYVVHQIEQLVGGTSYFSLDSGRVEDDTKPVNWAFGDFAVLYRLNSQSRLLVEAFERSGIPFQAVGQTSLYAQEPVQEILAYLWLLHTPESTVHGERVLGKSLSQRRRGAENDGRNAGMLGEEAPPIAPSSQHSLPMPESDAPSIISSSQHPALFSLFTELAALSPLTARIERIIAFLAEKRMDGFSTVETERIERLLRRAVPYGDDLRRFLEATALHSEADYYDPRADRVSLMTLHAAKGLEFPVVFVVGCEEGLLPYTPPGKGADAEEERRLFYVGMTRARQKLALIHAGRRFLYGQAMENPRSRFVGDIETALLEVQAARRRERPPEPEQVQLRLI
jgi:DNA helicase-2/ATP-dependent DNA helicase PcrA